MPPSLAPGNLTSTLLDRAIRAGSVVGLERTTNAAARHNEVARVSMTTCQASGADREKSGGGDYAAPGATCPGELQTASVRATEGFAVLRNALLTAGPYRGPDLAGTNGGVALRGCQRGAHREKFSLNFLVDRRERYALYGGTSFC